MPNEEGRTATEVVDREPEEAAAGLKDPAVLWRQVPPGRLRDDNVGYGRVPAFWFTLNCPYNYLFEIHRFQVDPSCLRPTQKEARRLRFQWRLGSPDLGWYLHALGTELCGAAAQIVFSCHCAKYR